jgi:hypothetical protein
MNDWLGLPLAHNTPCSRKCNAKRGLQDHHRSRHMFRNEHVLHESAVSNQDTRQYGNKRCRSSVKGFK